VLEAVRRDYPVVLHGVSLSIASTDPLDERYLADLAALARASDAAGDAEAAKSYQERGLAVSRAMNEAKSAAEMEVLLRR
jgi:uncharacterized protein (UPF0276 family)